MSLEHSPVRDNQGARTTSGADPPNDPDYWHALIDEKAAATFLGVTDRTMQAMRQRGDGPHFVRISSRCVKYTRFILKGWYDTRVRSSTSDPGEQVA